MTAPNPDPRPRSMAKSATAFRTISEVSAELDVPQHVLRFWETKFPQIRPLKRGGGRRYYRPEDVELLRRIQSLLYKEGYTIKGVQRLLREARGGMPQAGPDQQPRTGEEPRAAAAAETDHEPFDHDDDEDDHEHGHGHGYEEPGGMTRTQREDIEAVLTELIALRDMLRGGRK
ncbi:MerR family transcriptional regulator [Skermanella sp. TT6]|uniref:MerR family transcriptional regulator n=1 Tax=Skermanella cutis TaxID=2775420 RepID=A0ABX7BES8_9PROT|nr:MerR family transcriptional regulator [Skermanella sp. TT6]QQP92573.1 MerR family transcriptional regulator [Skermanella sp. TT6]